MAQTATVQIQMPEMGESVTEGIVLEWHVAEGDFVREGDTVVEVSTDKVDAEVPAPADGTITKLLVEVDDEVPVGAALAEMEAGGEPSGDSAEGQTAPPAGPVAGDGDSSSQAAGESPSPTPPAGREHREAPAGTNGGDSQQASGADVRATPVARRVAAENGVDLGSVRGSGPGDKVTKEDVIAAANGGGAAAPASPASGPAPAAQTTPGEIKPLRGPAAM
jgi:pyruvate/2-oxoglutarate dehydrogenase complex dihydrolipoamide acyltransferase (E2) component